VPWAANGGNGKSFSVAGTLGLAASGGN
jgi:hypothetical protein